VVRAENAVYELLEKRRSAGLLRSLKTPENLIDFCSNDYLGLARSVTLRQTIEQSVAVHSNRLNGSTGSRLLAGNSALAEELETELAAFHDTEAALIFNSGYDANVGLLASLPQRGDTLLTDDLIHASMIDGARLSVANRFKFRHNDLDDLENRLKRATGTVYVAIESVYSMDGDLAPLTEIVELCEHYEAALIVDEAHATGVFGPQGGGLVQSLGLQKRVFARVHTFGKALGVHGAAVVGSASLRDFLINFARSFVYSTALPPHSLLAIHSVYRFYRRTSPLLIIFTRCGSIFNSKFRSDCRKRSGHPTAVRF
jgi:8-amino-7-oxononanoate synthase